MAKGAKNFEYEFDPIKYETGGKEAEKVIWTTKSLNKAVEALNAGLPLKANPFIGKVTRLLKPDLVYRRTAEEIEDYIKCKQDPVYFAEKCYLMTPEGLQRCKMRDYQVNYLHHLQNNRFSILLSCRQAGKSVTTAIYCLWKILFNTDKTGLILSKSGAAGHDLLNKVKDMYLYLPYHLKCGTMKWNQSGIAFDNNSNISTEAFSPTAGLGKTINFLILDEFAWCPPNEVELFYNNIIPTVTTISDSNVCIMSTQNGFNLFYKIWKTAIEKKSIYAPFKIDWYQVPQWNTKTKAWDKRTEKWKNEMIGILGSEEAFYYQYGTQFSASDACLVSRECLKRIRDNTTIFNVITEEQCEEINLQIEHKDCLFIKPEYDIRNFVNGEHWYILCVDLAEGGGGDYTVFNIFEYIDKDKFEQIGYWKSNKVDLEKAALEFWLLAGQLFSNDRCLWSIEWNTYGALFYNLLKYYNEPDYSPDTSWRNNILPEGIELYYIAKYNRQPIDDDGSGKKKIPGIRFSNANKSIACSMLRMMFEKEDIIMTDIVTAGELENFEDKNGNGSYKAAFGHDDIIMTFCQLPLLKQTPRYKDYVEDFIANNTLNSVNAQYNNDTDVFNYFETSKNEDILPYKSTNMNEYSNPWDISK